MSEQSDFNLLEHQKIHYSNIKKSIMKHSRAIDASDTGTGKTFVAIKICKDLDLIPWVVCPKSVISSWNNVIKQAKIKKKHENNTRATDERKHAHVIAC